MHFSNLELLLLWGEGKIFQLKYWIKLSCISVQYNLYLIKNMRIRFINALTFNLSPKKHCGAVDDLLTIAPDGNVYMCPNLTSEKFVWECLKKYKCVERYEEKKKNAGIKEFLM